MTFTASRSWWEFGMSIDVEWLHEKPGEMLRVAGVVVPALKDRIFLCI